MKKVLCILLVAVCLFSLVGCSPLFPLTGLFNGIYYAANPDYEAEDATFFLDDLSITLTDAFYLSDEYDGYAWYDSTSGTSVCIEKHLFGASDYEAGYSVAEYAEQLKASIIEENGGEDGFASGYSDIVTEGEFAYFTYDAKFIFSFKYMDVVYKTNSAMYNVCFMCDLSKYDTYEEYFMRWARSAVINNSNAIAMLGFCEWV